MKKALYLFFFSYLLSPSLQAQIFSQTSLNFNNPNDLIIRANSGTNGIAVADYNQDGFLDIYFVVKENASGADASSRNRLFVNMNGTYFDHTSTAGRGAEGFTDLVQSQYGYKSGASWGDYNNDGYPDLFLANSGKDLLLKNRADGTFTNVTGTAGVAGRDSLHSTQGLWFDYDKDGDLDLYVSVQNDLSKQNKDRANRMYENVGDDEFIDVSAESGLNDRGLTFATVALDVNNDSHLDLYLANDFGPNTLYINNGNKTFTEQTEAFGLNDSGEGMGLAIGDPDNNGFFDIYLTNVTESGNSELRYNRLFLNTGTNFFEKNEFRKGVSEAGWGWGTEFFDFDNDGDEDLIIANGYQAQLEPEVNRLFRNTMDAEDTLAFEAYGHQAGIMGKTVSYTNAVFDEDNDGYLDILTSNFFQKPVFYRNNSSEGNWIKIWLEGVETNRNGFGSVVEVETGEDTFYRYYHGAGLYSQHILPVHIGLDEHEVIDKITVRWLNGFVDEVEDLDVNQTIYIKETEGLITSADEPQNSPVPDELKLIGNYPNPFNAGTQIRFDLAQTSRVTISIFNSIGQKVYEQSGSFSAGNQRISWNPSRLNSGVYLYKITTAEGISKTGKMLFLK